MTAPEIRTLLSRPDCADRAKWEDILKRMEAVRCLDSDGLEVCEYYAQKGSGGFTGD